MKFQGIHSVIFPPGVLAEAVFVAIDEKGSTRRKAVDVYIKDGQVTVLLETIKPAPVKLTPLPSCMRCFSLPEPAPMNLTGDDAIDMIG